MLVSGWLVTNFCSHAIGHWAVGRLVGIGILGYGDGSTVVTVAHSSRIIRNSSRIHREFIAAR
jgi:hypothetical protein